MTKTINSINVSDALRGCSGSTSRGALQIITRAFTPQQDCSAKPTQRAEEAYYSGILPGAGYEQNALCMVIAAFSRLGVTCEFGRNLK
jgi:hypothetical protein